MKREEVAKNYGLIDLKAEHKISDWEFNFLLSIALNKRILSDKQEAVYLKVLKRNEGHEGLRALAENWPNIDNI
jgi:hypothetical protein